MPRMTGGNTPLGQAMNEVGAAQDGVNISKVKTKTGIIVDFKTVDAEGNVSSGVENPKADGLYEFIVIIDGKPTGFIPYLGSVNKLCGDFGHPKDFIGSFCEVSFQGQSSNRGKITSLVDDRMDTLTSGAANQLKITGSAFAPPGNGLV